MTRSQVRGMLDLDLPCGLDMLFHSLMHAAMSNDDYLAACRRLGLDRLL